VFCLTHNYTGYPMVRQAKAMVEAGELGTIRLVQVEYVQGGKADEEKTSRHMMEVSTPCAADLRGDGRHRHARA
jgi:predicted dehydrogenase